MVSYNTKTFLEYLWHEHFHPSKFLKQSTFYIMVITGVISFIVISKNTSVRIKAFAVILYFVSVIIIQFYFLKKSGVHIGWKRKKLGMMSKKDLKEYKHTQEKKDNVSQLTNKIGDLLANNYKEEEENSVNTLPQTNQNQEIGGNNGC